ncbi:MAG: nucleotidyltransferase domain-containing protein [Oscillospiraceae bacterium]|jgi:predicted nucleotidyltransferase|nr:nucleotidyltransferase domain-containing protein [Oscillospiraceae bacterium]
MNITETIQEKLADIEKEKDVKILYAAESGSRAWGFESDDSDYDVRFIYAQSVEKYLQIQETRDVIELPIDGIWDINGWDLKKTLLLLHKSNPTLFEWGNSPLVYKTTEEWGKIKEIMNNYFLLKSGIWHYLSMTKSNFNEFLKDKEQIKLKKYFYCLRPILASMWILNEQTPPPMKFTELVSAELDKEILPFVEKLLNLKMNSAETKFISPVTPLNEYIEKNLVIMREKVESLPHQKTLDFEELNEVFRGVLGVMQ